jgi:DNA-binding MarR family transcriptional regulator
MPRHGSPLSEREFADLLAFRIRLRQFNRWSEAQAHASGLTHSQHQLLLAVRGHAAHTGRDEPPTVGNLAEHLLQRHHSVVELIDRVEAAGLVERRRDATDRRVVRVVLTSAGEDTIESLTELHLGELKRLAPALERLVGDMDEVPPHNITAEP